MGLQEILGIVKVKCEEAVGLQLAGEDGQAVSMLQQVATIINSEFGATDEVAADSTEDEEKSEEAKTVDLPGIYVQVHEHVREAEIAFAAGAPKLGFEHLANTAELLKVISATETR